MKQFCRYFIIDLQHPWIDYSHIQTGFDGVVQENRVDGFPDGIVSPEGEGYIGNSPAYFGIRKMFFDPGSCPEKIDGIVVMFLQTSTDGEDIRIEDDVFGRKENGVDQNMVGPFADCDPLFVGRCLSLLIECHHHHGSAVVSDFSGLPEELLLSLFKAY